MKIFSELFYWVSDWIEGEEFRKFGLSKKFKVQILQLYVAVNHDDKKQRIVLESNLLFFLL